jgi:hypothetical protein
MCVPGSQQSQLCHALINSSGVDSRDRVCAESDARTREAATPRAVVDVSSLIFVFGTVHYRAVSAEMTSLVL